MTNPNRSWLNWETKKHHRCCLSMVTVFFYLKLSFNETQLNIKLTGNEMKKYSLYEFSQTFVLSKIEKKLWETKTNTNVLPLTWVITLSSIDTLCPCLLNDVHSPYYSFHFFLLYAQLHFEVARKIIWNYYGKYWTYELDSI